MNLDNLAAWFDGIELMLDNKQQAIAKDVLKEIRERLQFLLDVGLTYLTIDRSSRTLSGENRNGSGWLPRLVPSYKGSRIY